MHNSLLDRQPSVAGQFYPENPEKLGNEVNSLFCEASEKSSENVRAIISPHAGYVFSGKIAASAFRQIENETSYKRVIILASSHREYFEGASVYCEGDYIMPFGKAKVDMEFGKMLVEKHKEIFSSIAGPHIFEHSIEVQLPFLYHALKTSFSIVPIIIGGADIKICRQIADVLKPWFNNENLFIISTDFSHYPSDHDARDVDFKTKDAIISNNPEKLLATIKNNKQERIPNLVTSLCGWTSVLTLMYMTAENDSFKYHAINYNNSGDSDFYGDKKRVVGYWAISVSGRNNGSSMFKISETDKTNLLRLARKTLEEITNEGKLSNFTTDNYSDILNTKCGAFVTLHLKGQLRGCIGRLTGNLPLYKLVQEMTVSSAIHDYRFQTVTKRELKEIDIEISVLSPLKKINDVTEIEIGKHGILIENGRRSGVFLPQVATETGWSLEDYLGHCSRDKAGLDWFGWKNSDIFIFTATVFGEKMKFD